MGGQPRDLALVISHIHEMHLHIRFDLILSLEAVLWEGPAVDFMVLKFKCLKNLGVPRADSGGENQTEENNGKEEFFSVLCWSPAFFLDSSCKRQLLLGWITWLSC